MPLQYLKKAPKTSKSDAGDVNEIVQNILDEIEQGGDEAALKYARKFDNYDGNIELTKSEIEAACALVPERLKADIRFAHDNVKRFAQAQKATLADIEYEVIPGLIAGQKSIPVRAAGCYVPGGRYSHIASAIMTVTTAKVAGCKNIVACSPPRPEVGIAPAIVYAAHIAGADRILALGGVQGIAAMTFGLFGLPKADILVGPGNQFVAEAKRILFGRVGIDLFAGPTETLIVVDEIVDAETCATDLIGQAEHGYNSPCVMITNSENLGRETLAEIDRLLEILPSAAIARASWRDYGEVIVCEDQKEMKEVADFVASEHVQLMTSDDDYFLANMKNYGAFFIGPRTNVAFGDKVIGTNHTLPTNKAARYTGGLWAGKFMKTCTYQRVLTDEASALIGSYASRLCLMEGFPGHAEQANVRVRKYGRINVPYAKSAPVYSQSEPVLGVKLGVQPRSTTNNKEKVTRRQL